MTNDIVTITAAAGEFLGSICVTLLGAGLGYSFIKMARKPDRRDNALLRRFELTMAAVSFITVGGIGLNTGYEAVSRIVAPNISKPSIDDCIGLMTTRMESMTDWCAKSAIAYRAQRICQEQPKP